ncbi:MAG TPA: rRNA maturation RNase YbeY [Candidatus Caenarcaniphilales bacterium]
MHTCRDEPRTVAEHAIWWINNLACYWSSIKVQVELAVQNCFSQPCQSAVVNPGCQDAVRASLENAPPVISETTWQAWFQCWLEILQPGISPNHTYELSLRLTDDTEIQQLNAQYRQQTQPTDVLAFAALEVDYPQFEGLSDLPVYLGDIVISIETAHQQAAERHHSLETELAWLACHGLLHLLGWDHPTEECLTQMLNQQDRLLAAIGFSQRLNQGSKT